jgi:hypothetical protein
MRNQLAAGLQHCGLRLVRAYEIGQVRDMVATVSYRDGTPEYHRTVQESVSAARPGPTASANVLSGRR